MGEVMTARAVTLRIEGTPAYSLNPNGGRKHWAVRHQEAQTVKGLVMAAVANTFCGFPEQFHGPVRLHWTVYLAKGGKRLDNDNMLSCLKNHQDGLVERGVIPGDSPKHIPETPTVEQITWGKHKGDPHIEVRIEQAAAAKEETR